jgi:preprotein translocase subunit SecE
LAVAAQSIITADKVKLVLAGLLALAAVVGFYWLSNAPLIARIGVLLLGVAAAIAVGWTSEPGKRFYVYCQESITETKKVVWPSRKETVQTTGIVVAFVIVMALFLWIIDASLVWLVKMLVGREA